MNEDLLLKITDPEWRHKLYFLDVDNAEIKIKSSENDMVMIENFFRRYIAYYALVKMEQEGGRVEDLRYTATMLSLWTDFFASQKLPADFISDFIK